MNSRSLVATDAFALVNLGSIYNDPSVPELHDPDKAYQMFTRAVPPVPSFFLYLDLSSLPSRLPLGTHLRVRTSSWLSSTTREAKRPRWPTKPFLEISIFHKPRNSQSTSGGKFLQGGNKQGADTRDVAQQSWPPLCAAGRQEECTSVS